MSLPFCEHTYLQNTKNTSNSIIVCENQFIEMKTYFMSLLWLCVCLNDVNTVSTSLEKNANVKLSRRKRYVVFPEGASFSIALCLTTQIIIPNQIFTEGVNWGLSYDLPNDSRSDAIRAFTRPNEVLMRRRRRDLYEKLEVAIDAMGFDGRTCLYRTLCEAAQRFVKGSSLVEELLRIIFRFPHKKITVDEPNEHHMYSWAHKMGHERNNCANLFDGCPYSLLGLALGDYSNLDAT